MNAMVLPLTRRQVEVATAAAPVFLENGFTRTTMGALAAAAGLTRPGLYLIFPHKEAAFAAAVTVLDAQLHQSIEEALAGIPDRRARLAYVCERWVAGVYDLQTARPWAKDMDDLAFPIVRQVYGRFIDLVARLLREGRESDLDAAIAQDLARVAMFGLRGFFATASDGADMRALVRLHINGLLRSAENFVYLV